MRITYDPEANAVYIELRRARASEGVDVEDGVTAALDADGHVVGLEILDARERLGANPLAVSLEQLSEMKAGHAPAPSVASNLPRRRSPAARARTASS